MRKPFVAGNWKMHTLCAQAEDLAKALVQSLGSEKQIDLAVFPPFPYLMRVGAILKGSAIELGAQNTHPDTEGAYTGEVSPPMLVDCGCSWVIVGHSERRHLLEEDDDFIRRKLTGALNVGLKVILCVGETLAQREAQQTDNVLESQLIGCLEGLATDRLAKVVIAYEPVWAIGTGRTATPDQAEQAHQFIRTWLENQLGPDTANATRILYGGSVNSQNAANLVRQPNVDGALVGGASLKADEFTAIVQAVRSTLTGSS